MLLQIVIISGILAAASANGHDHCQIVFSRTETDNAKQPLIAYDLLADISDLLKDLKLHCSRPNVIIRPFSGNGTAENIAGICNAGKNVFGMMPHPERASADYLFNKDGVSIFESIFSLQPQS